MHTKPTINQKIKDNVVADDEKYDIGWSDTFTKNENSAFEGSEVDTSFSMDKFEEPEVMHMANIYNHTYIRMKFYELILRINAIENKENSDFLYAISIAECINKELPLFEIYPFERQVLSLTKNSLGKIMKEDNSSAIKKLIKLLNVFSSTELNAKTFETFRKSLVQQNLIGFAS